MKKKINQIIIIFLTGYLIIAVLFWQDLIDQHNLNATLYAGLLNMVNTFLALMLYQLSYKKNNKSFLLMNLGGMGLRLFLVVGTIFIFFKFLNIDKYGFIFTFFIFYFVFLIIEVDFFRKKAGLNNKGFAEDK
ncbi:MAG: hypothetical protein PVH88_04675 [Ignavibacteria bacterium]|jgi:hypothetical protein